MYRLMGFLSLCCAAVLVVGCGGSDKSTDIGPNGEGGSPSAADGAASNPSSSPEVSVAPADGGAVSAEPASRDASSSSGNARGDCAASCAAVGAAGCEYFSLTGCLGACNTQKINGAGHCDAEFASYHSCHANASFRCVEGGPKTDACTAEYGLLDSCLAAHPLTCTAPSGASACDVCLAKNCCSEREGCDAGCRAYRDCEQACKLQSCVDACLAQNPDAEQPAFWYDICVDDECSSECK